MTVGEWSNDEDAQVEVEERDKAQEIELNHAAGEPRVQLSCVTLSARYAFEHAL